MADLLLIPEAVWREAQRLAEVVHRLAKPDYWPRHMVRAAAAALGITRQTLYRHVDPNGLFRLDSEKLLGRIRTRSAAVSSR